MASARRVRRALLFAAGLRLRNYILPAGRGADVETARGSPSVSSLSAPSRTSSAARLVTIAGPRPAAGGRLAAG